MGEVQRTYEDTEIASLYVNVECPYCGHEQQELDMDCPGATFIITCEECEKEYQMYFDVD